MSDFGTWFVILGSLNIFGVRVFVSSLNITVLYLCARRGTSGSYSARRWADPIFIKD